MLGNVRQVIQMTMSVERPAGARHTANSLPRVTPAPSAAAAPASAAPASAAPTPAEVALRARIAELEAEKAELEAEKAELTARNAALKSENERLLATNTAVWRKIAEQDRKLHALQNNREWA